MYIRWIGAGMILVAGTGFGLYFVREHRNEERALEELIRVLDLMISEIQFRLTPLPQLCAIVSQNAKWEIGRVFTALEKALITQTQPDGAACMDHALEEAGVISRSVYRNLKVLGQTLGRFDADGQINGFSAAKELCQRDLAALQKDQDVRLRTYQTLGICAGIALVIVLI